MVGTGAESATLKVVLTININIRTLWLTCLLVAGKEVLFSIGVSDRRELVECYAGWLNSLAPLWNRIICRWHSTPTCQFTPVSKTRIPAELVTCERICGST